jgi:hypothetical protein
METKSPSTANPFYAIQTPGLEAIRDLKPTALQKLLTIIETDQRFVNGNIPALQEALFYSNTTETNSNRAAQLDIRGFDYLELSRTLNIPEIELNTLHRDLAGLIHEVTKTIRTILTLLFEIQTKDKVALVSDYFNFDKPRKSENGILILLDIRDILQNSTAFQDLLMVIQSIEVHNSPAQFNKLIELQRIITKFIESIEFTFENLLNLIQKLFPSYSPEKIKDLLNEAYKCIGQIYQVELRQNVRQSLNFLSWLAIASAHTQSGDRGVLFPYNKPTLVDEISVQNLAEEPNPESTHAEALDQSSDTESYEVGTLNPKLLGSIVIALACNPPFEADAVLEERDRNYDAFWTKLVNNLQTELDIESPLQLVQIKPAGATQSKTYLRLDRKLVDGLTIKSTSIFAKYEFPAQIQVDPDQNWMHFIPIFDTQSEKHY